MRKILRKLFIASLVLGSIITVKTVEAQTIKNRWIQHSNNTWSYYNEKGQLVENGWELIHNNQYSYFRNSIAVKNEWIDSYYINSNNYMSVNQWIQHDNGKWSYVGNDGKRIENGWYKIPHNGKYSYFRNGISVENEWIGDKYLDSNGYYNSNYKKQLKHNNYGVAKMEFNGKVWKLSDCIANNFYEESVQKIQSYIDSGGVALNMSEINFLDNRFSHISGHNPGTLSYLANNIGDGKIVTIYDKSGNSKDYRLSFFCSVDRNNRSNLPSKLIEVLDDPYSIGEAILIQFCNGSEIDFWIGK